MRVQGGDGFLLTELLGKKGILLPPAGVVKQFALQDANLAVEVLLTVLPAESLTDSSS